MITIRGAAHRYCDGVSRRDVLRIGTLGIAGFALTDLLRLRAEASPTTGNATSIIMVHLSGGPSHIDTYDPKPDAPSQYRGEFKAIPTKVDGIQICEHFPLQAGMMDRLTLLRSVYGGPDDHSSSHTTTGYSNNERRIQGDKPSVGSVVARFKGKTDGLLPSYVCLRGVDSFSGLGAAYLGGEYEPLNSTGPGRQDLQLRISAARLANRRKMLEHVDDFRRIVDSRAVTNQDAFTHRALEVVASSATYDALNLSKESADTRKRYGNDQFLLARRLVESGVDAVALETGGWDTHDNNFRQLKNLMPPLDKAFTALITDLKDRGLDDRTLVIMWGEFGRTPKVNAAAGRDHYPRVMSAMVAGGGLKMGQVIGSSDANGTEPADNPCTIRSVIATLYHALGIDPHTVMTDGQGRPVPLIHDADPVRQLIG